MTTKIEDIKNYGKNLHDISNAMSKRTANFVKKESVKVIKKEMGLINAIRLAMQIPKKRKEFAKNYLLKVRETCPHEGFINEMFERAAIFSAMSKYVGEDKAVEIHNKILDKVMPTIGREIFPDPEVLKSFNQPFEACKRYVLSTMEADKKFKMHEYEIVENNSEALQFNVRYCAWYEIKKLLGVPKAALPDCYGDEVFLPVVFREAGVRFMRTQTIARGANYCDYRFEKMK